MNSDFPRYLIYIGLVLLVFSLARGCRSTTRDSLYTGAPFGPGAVISAKGRLHAISDGEGNPWAELRIRESSLRVRQPDTTPVGRIRVTGDGWEYLGRDGFPRCQSASEAASSSGELPLSITCGDQRWSVELQDGAPVIRDESGATRLLSAPLREQALVSVVQGWGNLSHALVFDAADDGLALNDPRFEAQLLLAWLARSLELAFPEPASAAAEELVEGGENDPNADEGAAVNGVEIPAAQTQNPALGGDSPSEGADSPQK